MVIYWHSIYCGFNKSETFKYRNTAGFEFNTNQANQASFSACKMAETEHKDSHKAALTVCMNDTGQR